MSKKSRASQAQPASDHLLKRWRKRYLTVKAKPVSPHVCIKYPDRQVLIPYIDQTCLVTGVVLQRVHQFNTKIFDNREIDVFSNRLIIGSVCVYHPVTQQRLGEIDHCNIIVPLKVLAKCPLEPFDTVSFTGTIAYYQNQLNDTLTTEIEIVYNADLTCPSVQAFVPTELSIYLQNRINSYVKSHQVSLKQLTSEVLHLPNNGQREAHLAKLRER